MSTGNACAERHRCDRESAHTVRGHLNEEGLDLLFRNARSHNDWLPNGVTDAQLRKLWNLVKWGPTSANCSPMRLLFLRSSIEKERLRPHLHPANVAKTMTAPVVTIIGFDTAFYEDLPRLFPHNLDAKNWFAGEANRTHADATAFRNGSLQAGYLIIAARAMGLDCGPLSGFDQENVDRIFWAGTTVKTNFICNLGYGDPSKLFPRHPRFTFEDVCAIR